MELTQSKELKNIYLGEGQMITIARQPAAPILMYHRIGNPRRGSIVSGQYVSPQLFEKQLRFLQRRGYTPMCLANFLSELRHPKARVKPIAITFDDGYESAYAEALPILKKLGITATFFVVAGQVGESNAWDEEKGDVTECMMGIEQIIDVHRQGMEIGSHTSSHPDLLLCSDEHAMAEIQGSKKLLETILGKPVDWFSYPYGRENDHIRSLVRSAGYVGACGTRRSLNTARTNRFSLGRLNIRATTTIPWMIYKFARAARNEVAAG